jgi:hypothetical protein
MTCTAQATRIASDSPFCESQQQMKKIEDDLTSASALNAPLHEIEQMLRTQGREMMRLMMQTHLDHRAAMEQRVEVRDVDGVERTQVRHGTRLVETEFGEVEVGRNLYQAMGREGLAPADAVMALPTEKYSYEVRRMVAVEAARSSFDEVVEAIEKYSGAAVPKRQAEELTVRAARDFDAFYRDRLCAPEVTDHLMVLSFDGKGIAMRLESLRAATRKAAESTPRQLHTRLVKGEKPNRKRMAEVAAVYTLARWERTVADVLHGPHAKRTDRPRPINKRVWASVEHSAQQVIDDGFAEALRRDPDRRRRWVVLVDGSLDQLRRIKRAARAAGVAITITLDLIHVLEYLWRAAHAFYPGDTPKAKAEAEAWVECRLLALLTGRSGGEIAKSLRLMIATHDLDAKAKRAVERAANYLVRHTRLMHYDRALADGLPIATGVIEGACRHLVQDRMGRTGARWSLACAEAVLRLRALRASGDFDDYWHFHLAKEHERNHQSRYADGEVPKPLPPMPPRRPHLALVK